MEQTLLSHLSSLNLINDVDRKKEVFKKILINCLGATKKENILLITDNGYENQQIAPMLSSGYAIAAKELNLNLKVVIQEPLKLGEKASDEASRNMKELREESIIIVCVSGKVGTTKYIGKSFRKFAKENMHRYISTTGMRDLRTEDFNRFVESLDIDYDKMKERCALIKDELIKADEIRVTTDRGTDLTLKIKKSTIHINDGNYTESGTGGNMPCGEVYLAPLKKQAEGRAVIDLSSKNIHGTTLLTEPIELIVEGGEVVRIIGDNSGAEKLRETIEWAEINSKYPWGIRRLAELGIGTNPKAQVSGNMIIDEKILGSAHVAIGSNAWFGGSVYAKIHVDQVMKEPQFYLDGKEFNINRIFERTKE